MNSSPAITSFLTPAGLVQMTLQGSGRLFKKTSTTCPGEITPLTRTLTPDSERSSIDTFSTKPSLPGPVANRARIVKVTRLSRRTSCSRRNIVIDRRVILPLRPVK